MSPDCFRLGGGRGGVSGDLLAKSERSEAQEGTVGEMVLPSQVPDLIAKGRKTDARLVYGTPEAIDKILAQNGWRPVEIEHGRFFMRGDQLAFSRGQTPGSSIVQWMNVDDHIELPRGEGGRTLHAMPNDETADRENSL